jgi:hypothetical protein
MTAIDGFPGVDVSVQHLPEGGVQVRARLVTFAVARLREADLAGATEGQATDLIERAARHAAEMAMRHAAATALPHVGVDWSDLFKLGTVFTDERGRHGTVVAIVRPTDTISIAWPDGTVEYPADDILDALAGRRWTV